MAFRAFYALPVDNFATSTGQFTNAVHGCVAMLIKLVAEEQPTHVAVAFDVAFPDSDTGREAAGLVERLVRLSHEKNCTVSRTVEAGNPITMRVN